jgi:hypothetical protein
MGLCSVKHGCSYGLVEGRVDFVPVICDQYNAWVSFLSVFSKIITLWLMLNFLSCSVCSILQNLLYPTWGAHDVERTKKMRQPCNQSLNFIVAHFHDSSHFLQALFSELVRVESHLQGNKIIPMEDKISDLLDLLCSLTLSLGLLNTVSYPCQKQ